MRSRFEESFAADLKRRGLAYQYEQDHFDYTIAATYTPDFRLDGCDWYLETKGIFDAPDRRKLLAVRRDNPGIDIRLVFQRAKNTISKTSKTTYGQWCDKHGFKWAEKFVPKEWLDDRRSDPDQPTTTL